MPHMMTEREAFVFTIRMALRKVPPGTLRDLAKRRLPHDDLCEQIVAETIVEHIQRSNWIVRQGPPARPHKMP